MLLAEDDAALRTKLCGPARPREGRLLGVRGCGPRRCRSGQAATQARASPFSTSACLALQVSRRQRRGKEAKPSEHPS